MRQINYYNVEDASPITAVMGDKVFVPPKGTRVAIRHQMYEVADVSYEIIEAGSDVIERFYILLSKRS